MSDSVQSIVRAFNIIETIAEHNNSMTITELSQKVTLHKSTVHRLLNTLIQLGYVKQNAQTSQYELTLKCFEIGVSIVKQNDLISVARPYLEALRDLSGEVVHLVIPDDKEIIYIDKVESTQTLRMHSFVGKRAPLYCTAVGKAILADQPSQAIENYWQSIDPIKYTPNTIVTLDAFFDELSQIKIEGISFDNEEQESGIRCIAVSLKNYSGETIGALSISGPLGRMTDDKMALIKPELLKIKLQISKQIGRF